MRGDVVDERRRNDRHAHYRQRHAKATSVACDAVGEAICPATLPHGTACAADAATQIAQWTNEGRYPCVYDAGQVCGCSGIPLGNCPVPAAGELTWVCSPAAPCPAVVPAEGASCVQPGLECSYARFCEARVATCSDQGTWSVELRTGATPAP